MVLATSLDSSQTAAGDLVAAMPPLGSSLAANSVIVDRVAPHPTRLDSVDEKPLPSDDLKDTGSPLDEKDPRSYADEQSDNVKFVNGQPIIETVCNTIQVPPHNR